MILMGDSYSIYSTWLCVMVCLFIAFMTDVTKVYSTGSLWAGIAFITEGGEVPWVPCLIYGRSGEVLVVNCRYKAKKESSLYIPSPAPFWRSVYSLDIDRSRSAGHLEHRQKYWDKPVLQGLV